MSMSTLPAADPRSHDIVRYNIVTILKGNTIPMKYLLSTLVAVSVTTAAFAAPQQQKAPAAKKAAAAPAPKVLKVGDKTHCAVMGEDMKVAANSLKSTYKGKTYYFCCPGCKPAFDKNPAKYVKAEPAKKAVPAKPATKKPA